MGVMPIEENVRVVCVDGSTVTVSADTTTSDMSMGDEGSAGVYGTLGDGREFSFQMPLMMYNESWFRRFCDAIAAHPAFRDSLPGLEEIEDGFSVPSAPSRNGGAIGQLVRMGHRAKFRDFADLRSGRDKFSSMKLPELERAVSEPDARQVKRAMSSLPDDEQATETAKALRWILRGLPAGMAVRKTQVDREITENVKQKRR